MPQQYFTLAEANKALKIIRPLLDEVMEIREKILEHRPEIWSVMEKSAGNGGNPTLSRMVKSFDRLDELLHIIQDTGAQIKDINSGLLDFSAVRDGHEVYLCWKYGEDDISFWHEIDAGFAGRQPIEDF